MMRWLAEWNWSGYSMHRVDRARYLSIECLRGALLLLVLCLDMLRRLP